MKIFVRTSKPLRSAKHNIKSNNTFLLAASPYLTATGNISIYIHTIEREQNLIDKLTVKSETFRSLITLIKKPVVNCGHHVTVDIS